MSSRIVPLRDVDAKSIAAVAALHVAEIPSLLAELGRNWTVLFYAEASRREDTIGFVIFDDDAVAGFVVGGPSPGSLLSSLYRRPAALAWELLRRPRVLWQAALSRWMSSKELSGDAASVELMYIAAGPAFRGRGFGSELIQKFVEAAAERGARVVSLSVESENKPAIALYQTEGFANTRTVREGKFDRLRMERCL